MFNNADLDGDGVVTNEEFIEFISNEYKTHAHETHFEYEKDSNWSFMWRPIHFAILEVNILKKNIVFE